MHLAYLLRNAEKQFVVLTVITEETDESIKKMMKLFIKDKAKLYPKVKFLFYSAKKQDFGKWDPVFNKNMSEYPKMFHLWDVKRILTGVISIDNKEILESSFEDLHEVYLAGKMPEKEKEEYVSEHEENTIEESNLPNKISQKQNNNKPIQNSIPPSIQIQQQYKDPLVEKKKFVEKIKLLQEKQKENYFLFLRELQKRKEEEESGEEKKEKKVKFYIF